MKPEEVTDCSQFEDLFGEKRPWKPWSFGFPTMELVNMFSALYMSGWPNLVRFGTEEDGGLFYPLFNVWD